MCGSTLIPQHFHHPQNKPCTHWQSLVFPLSERGLATTNYFLSLRICLFWTFHLRITIYGLVWLVSLAQRCVKSSFMLQHVSLLCSFFIVKQLIIWMYIFLICSADKWVVSTFQPVWTMLFVYRFSFLLGLYLGMELFDPIGEGNGNPLQYSCLENPMDGGAW